MKDYSKVKYVKYLQGECSYHEKGKTYKVIKNYDDGYSYIESETKCYSYIQLHNECLHLGDCGYWIPCDENGKEIEL